MYTFFYKDDSCLSDVVNACLMTCKRPSIGHYHKKHQSTQLQLNVLGSGESENEKSSVSFIDNWYHLFTTYLIWF